MTATPPPPTLKNTATVLLAGGQGSRIGGHKPAVLYRGHSLLEWSCQILTAIPISNEVKIISVGSDKALFVKEFNLIADLEPNQGPLGGILTALESPQIGDCDWLFTLPVDMPNLPRDCLEQMMAAYQTDCSIIRAASRVRSFPTVSLIATVHGSDLRHYMSRGGRKIFDFQNQFKTIEARILSPSQSLNINRREDLEE